MDRTLIRALCLRALGVTQHVVGRLIGDRLLAFEGALAARSARLMLLARRARPATPALEGDAR